MSLQFFRIYYLAFFCYYLYKINSLICKKYITRSKIYNFFQNFKHFNAKILLFNIIKLINYTENLFKIFQNLPQILFIHITYIFKITIISVIIQSIANQKFIIHLKTIIICINIRNSCYFLI